MDHAKQPFTPQSPDHTIGMDQTKQSFSLQCPDHPLHVIGMLNIAPNAKKTGYCYECIAHNGRDGIPFETLKTVSTYLKDSSVFYEKCRQRVGDPPAEFLEELSKKGELLDRMSKHIGQEKEKVKRGFQEIRKTVLKIINEKEKECLELLDKEISDSSAAYTHYEKLLTMGWPKPSDIQKMYPETETLAHKMSQIESIGQLQTFMTGVHEDVQMQDEYFVEGGDLSKIKKKIDGLVRSLNRPEGSLPKIQSQILKSENLESLMKDLMKGFIQQEVQVENSIASRIKMAATFERKIFDISHFFILKNWLPKGYEFDLKLLFRGSADGMSGAKFHQRCDGQGATIILIKCRFDGAVNSKILGGFLDQSWHSENKWSSSKEAFLFSLAEDSGNSVKCPILENQFEQAFRGRPHYGPMFGGGNDLYLEGDLKTGKIYPHSYSNSVARMEKELHLMLKMLKFFKFYKNETCI